MPSKQKLDLSPVTGEMIPLRRTASAAPSRKPNSKPEAQRTIEWNPTYSKPAPPPLQINYNFRDFININNYGPPSRPSHQSSRRHNPSTSEYAQPHRRTEYSHTRVPTAPIPGAANSALEAYSKTHRSRSATMERGVHFTQSVSDRERQVKRWDTAGAHRTNYASKSGMRPPAKKVERLLCERCHEGSQRWREGGAGQKLCRGCYEERRTRRR